jgi:hypothetical protein
MDIDEENFEGMVVEVHDETYIVPHLSYND